MSRYERTGKRSLAYSQWHRTLPHSVTMIDVDGLEYCQRCRAPLAVIETARDVGQAVKPATVLRRLAKAANVPAYVLLYTVDEGAEQREDWVNCIRSFRARRAHPDETEYRQMTPLQMAQLLVRIHTQHVCA